MENKTEKIFEVIRPKNFPKMTYIKSHVQKAQRLLIRKKSNKTPSFMIKQFRNLKTEKISKEARRKKKIRDCFQDFVFQQFDCDKLG